MNVQPLYLPPENKAWQAAIEANPTRNIVIAAGRRSGKTTLAVKRLSKKALRQKDAVCFYVAPTYQQAKDIAWAKFKYTLQDAIANNLVAKVHESGLYIMFRNGSLIMLKGADKPDTLRGIALHDLVLDEYGVMKPIVWNEVLRPAMSDHVAPALFIGTPKGKNHFFDLFKRGKSGDPAWYSLNLKTTEAGTLPQTEIDQAKRDMDIRAFRQEYEASFETFGGQVFPFFDRNVHVKAFDFQPMFETYWGVDFGWSSPTAILLIQVAPDETIFVVDELKAIETPIREAAMKMIDRKWARIVSLHPRRETNMPDKVFCDPAGSARNEATGTSSVVELRAMGLNVHYRKPYEGVIQDRVALIRKWGMNKKLFIHPRCVNLIDAMEGYRYADPKGGIQSEIPLKDGVTDHWIDGFGYFFLNRFPLRKSEIGVI